MQFLLICLVGLLVFVHASLASPPVISGQVRLPDGSPVAGAQVVLFDVADLGRGPVGQTTTDETGQFALPLAAASGALVLPREVGLGAELSQSVQSLDDHSLPTAGTFAGAVGSVQHPRPAGGDAGGWRASGRGVSGAMGWHGCGGSCRGLGGVYLPLDGGGSAVDGEDGAGGWAGGGAAGRTER